MKVRKLLAAGGLTLGIALSAAPAHATQNHNDKVTICHVTGSATNPYVRIHVSENAIGGHDHHQGDIIVEDNNDDFQCPNPSQGPKGDPGDNGNDGQTPTILCFPGQGLGYTFNPEGYEGDGEILAEGDICDLKGDKGDTGETGAVGPQGPEGLAGAAGTPGTPGAAGVDGQDGQPGLNADNSIVTELNNRLFVLEHADTTTVAGEQAEQPVPAAPVGELPHTGSDTTAVLAAVAFVALLLGGVLRFAAKR